MQPIVDANIVLRYLLADDPSQTKQATEAIEAGCELMIETITEIVYVLRGRYEVPRSEIATTLSSLLESGTVYVQQYEEVNFALQLYADKNIDFIDCLLVAQNQINGREIITFDKKLQKLLQ